MKNNEETSPQGVAVVSNPRVPLQILDRALDAVEYENIDLVKVLSRDAEQARSARNFISRYLAVVSSYAQLDATKRGIGHIKQYNDEHVYLNETVAAYEIGRYEVSSRVQELAVKAVVTAYYHLHYSDGFDEDVSGEADTKEEALFLDDLKDNVGNAQGVVYNFARSINTEDANRATLALVDKTKILEQKLRVMKEADV